MSNGARLVGLMDVVTRWMGRAGWLGPLLARLTVGYVFLIAGWGKLNNLDKVRAFFESLQIPAASIQAPFVATVEFVGGILLIIGLCTRFASVFLLATMIVALLTAKRGDIDSLGSLFDMSEYLYAVMLTWLAVAGAGAASVDARVRKLWG